VIFVKKGSLFKLRCYTCFQRAIDYWSQFHQHFTCAFFVRKCNNNVIREKLRKALLYEKRMRKMLMKLTPACNKFRFQSNCFGLSQPKHLL